MKTLLTLILTFATLAASFAADAQNRANFVVIMGEAQGMRFGNFYAALPRCTPARAAFFTGRSPAGLHMKLG